MTSSRDALAAETFPEQWSQAATAPGCAKQRNRLRKAAEVEQKLRDLRLSGACCGECEHYETDTPYPGWTKGAWCSLFSDRGGYSPTEWDDLCPSFSGRVSEKWP